MPSGRRAEPIFLTCHDCGKPYPFFGCNVLQARHCPACRLELQKERNRINARISWDRKTPEEKRALAVARHKAVMADPAAREQKRKVRRRWAKDNAEKVTEWNRQYYWEHREAILEKRKEKRRRNRALDAARSALRRRRSNDDVVASRWERDMLAGRIHRCDRLHLSAVNLPCGNYPACHKCPQDMRPPSERGKVRERKGIF